ncbi:MULTISPECIES: MFS transporter [unclassified Alteromonas]|uniref:MFS transporter n=1 Tax=unclassified Alteromonas TaxID=2614992 RepID=UPI001923368A|nr:MULTISPECIES: MFS transporter [unclassified Alteromonas]WDT87287.1 MFS transporter [Alteromonas sp. 009811495]BCO18295.1 MFS transporter [Alteromonas sp. KC3]BCO22255.1 MFS transporter [Alteromonas sp. KC14]
MKDSLKPTMSFWQIWNMCFGFFGIQYGFGLQQANLSPIFRYHGAAEHELPILWLAGPVTGLLIQPLIGVISDGTWTRFGRRKPFFMMGALVGSIAVMFMPYVPELWMVVGLFWMLDAAMNTAMEPYRALVGDKVNHQQRPLAYALQTFMVAAGQMLAGLMPLIMIAFGVSIETDGKEIPEVVKYSFIAGVVVILISSTWSFFTTKEIPPEDIAAFRKNQQHKSVGHVFSELLNAMLEMPKSLKAIWWVKLATWFALPLMWQYLSLSIARHVYNAPTPDSPGFVEGTAQVGMAFTIMNIATIVMAFVIVRCVKLIGDANTYALFLLIGGAGFLSMQLTTDLNMTFVCMALIGVGWSAVMTVPFIITADVTPAARVGVYMGLLNAMICLPQILEMVTIGYVYDSLLASDPRNALALSGVLFIIGAGLALRINSKPDHIANQEKVG